MFLTPSANAATDLFRNSSRLLSAGTSVLISLEVGGFRYQEVAGLGGSSDTLGSGRACVASHSPKRWWNRTENLSV